MRNVKKIFSMLLCLCMCFLLMNNDASAAGNRDGEIVDGTLLTSDTSSTGETVHLARGTYLSSGSCAIKKESSSSVQISGTTLCNRFSDSVVVNLYLEREVGGSWESYEQRSHTEYNTASSNYTTTISVTPGYYYRVCGSYVVKKGNTVESDSSQTRGIYIG